METMESLRVEWHMLIKTAQDLQSHHEFGRDEDTISPTPFTMVTLPDFPPTKANGTHMQPTCIPPISESQLQSHNIHAFLTTLNFRLGKNTFYVSEQTTNSNTISPISPTTTNNNNNNLLKMPAVTFMINSPVNTLGALKTISNKMHKNKASPATVAPAAAASFYEKKMMDFKA
ncbi:hypothetical protein HDV05_001105 [Chytridiales sp. JEL 0842]|nr:hypothetical protein HDV05_001105 [Chytridiales sp. JEL 0842]